MVADSDARGQRLRRLQDAWRQVDEDSNHLLERVDEFEELYDEVPDSLQAKVESVNAALPFTNLIASVLVAP